MAFHEYPKTLYRWEGDILKSCTFASAEAVEPGWTSIDDLGPNAFSWLTAKATNADPISVASIPADGLPKLYNELLAENDALKESVKLLEDELAARERKIAGLTFIVDEARESERVAQLAARIAAVAQDATDDPAPPARKRARKSTQA